MDAFMLAANKDFHELRERNGMSYGEGELKARHILPFTEARAAEVISELFRPRGASAVP